MPDSEILKARIARAELISPSPDRDDWIGARVYRDGGWVLISERRKDDIDCERADKAALIELLELMPEALRFRFHATTFVGEHEGRKVYEQQYLEPWLANDEQALKLVRSAEYQTLQSALGKAIRQLRRDHPEWDITNDTPQAGCHVDDIDPDDIRTLNGEWCLIDPIGVWIERKVGKARAKPLSPKLTKSD